ncbi:MAG: DUF1573 domain-containing protein [Bacteroidales bacterium]|nr:DUF1573 domain-containing protein [Bacteroidales bacterium]
MKRRFLLICLAAFMMPLMSQTVQPKISFNEIEHDFGKFREADGKVSYKFEFVNTGGSDLIIQNVSASCGCTAPRWTREPVPPGGKGYVAATYDPAGRPGAFRKYVTVISNSNPGSVRLTIAGEVEPKPRTIEDDYRYAMGPLRLQSNHLAFGNLKHTANTEKQLEVINNSDENVSVAFQRVPGHVTIKMEPATLKPGQKGMIIAGYSAPERNDWGFVIDRMPLDINGKTERTYSLVVSANIEEDFSALSEAELARAPVIHVDDTEFQFGKISQGEKVEHTYVLSNSGKSDLLIRKVKASCGCTAVQPEKNVIAPGESVNIKTVFNSAGKLGNQNKTVTIITNDPRKSKLILWVKGEVIKTS